MQIKQNKSIFAILWGVLLKMEGQNVINTLTNR